MFTGLLHTHGLLRWVVVVLMILSIVEFLKGRKGGVPFEGKSRKIFLFTLIAVHVQVLLGLVMYFLSDTVSAAMDSGAVMSDSANRFWVVEHLTGMLVGAILITVGWSKAKRLEDDQQKFKKIGLLYIIGFVIILATIPWPFREIFSARPWFPGM